MIDIFTYPFMIRAFAVAFMIALCAPCIGLPIVLKRFSAIGDATSHSALGGIAFGLIIGINPIVGAVVFSIVAVLSVEKLRKAFGTYHEIATELVLLPYSRHLLKTARQTSAVLCSAQLLQYRILSYGCH